MNRFWIFLILILVSVPADAQRMHRWVDESGQVHFSQTPPPDQRSQQSETSEMRRGGTSDMRCCQDVRSFSSRVSRALYQGMSILEIHAMFPANSYPHVVEVTNFVSERVRMEINSNTISGMAFDACMNATLQACRVAPARTATGAPSARAPGGESQGSGIALGEGLFLTNFHVIDNCRSIRIGKDAVPAEHVASDPGLDLALLRSNMPTLYRAVIRNRTGVDLGENLVVAGYPLGQILGSLNVTTGTVSAQSGPAGSTQLFQITAPVQPGNSGGPVVDDKGLLMGVVVSRMSDDYAYQHSGALPQNINFAIQPDRVRAFLDRHDVRYESSSANATVSTQGIAAQAQHYTVPISCR
jgi:S1-C subfamily serine protease